MQKTLETEMRGPQNFSEYESKRLKKFAHQAELKEALSEMLKVIYKERPAFMEQDAKHVLLYMNPPVPFKKP